MTKMSSGDKSEIRSEPRGDRCGHETRPDREWLCTRRVRGDDEGGASFGDRAETGSEKGESHLERFSFLPLDSNLITLPDSDPFI